MKTVFDYGENVYLTTDPQQMKRVVTGYIVRRGLIMYLVVCGTEETSHFDFELSYEPDVMMTSTN